MPQSHHRKKHKAHLKQFQYRQENLDTTPTQKAAVIFTIVGAVIGLAVSYFSSGSAIVILAVATVAGAVIGYLFGKSIDRRK